MAPIPNKKKKVQGFNVRHLDDAKAVSDYLTRTLETGGSTAISEAIGNVAKARGIARIAAATGLDRSNLYRSFRGPKNPDFATLVTVIEALGLRFVIRPSK